MSIPLLVFTDLDGTLLDHDSYDHAPALPTIAAVKRIGGRIVLASSKTAAEIADLHAALDLGETPAIVENGAALYRPGDEARDDAYAALRAVLDALPEKLRQPFRGFGDMDVAAIASLTGLPPDQAAKAKTRAHSEPGLWTGDADGKAAFLDALKAHGITARQGGRFMTLSHGATKADRMAEISDSYRPSLTLALGDAPNDVEMIEAADRGVIIRNDHGPGIPTLSAEATGRIIRTGQPGPSGWNDAVLQVIAEITRTGQEA